jgi:predicted DNA binding CopG/RHH family protein
MAEKKKVYPNPKFSSRENEDQYWEKRSPLAEGYKGEVNKEKQKRSSFLTIRLTGEELTELRDMASAKGMGPSTFIRSLVKDVIGNNSRNVRTIQYGKLADGDIKQFVYDSPNRTTINLEDMKDRSRRQSTKTFYPIIVAELQTITPELLNEFLSGTGVQVISSNAEEYNSIKRIISVTHQRKQKQTYSQQK